MKSKKLLRTLAALCTALVLMGGFSVPAYAGGGGEPADETNDSNVQVEQSEETPPLTPDGNATLVDDYGGNKQLITPLPPKTATTFTFWWTGMTREKTPSIFSTRWTKPT